MRSSNVILTALAFAVAFAGSSCSTSAAGGEIVDGSRSSFISKTDPELHSALALIDKAPDSKMAYNNLAVLYIKRARDTGDFGLYSKAEAAVEKALQVDPADGPARKLQVSLFLTNHRFNEALEQSTALDREFPNDAFIKGVLTDAHMELGNYAEAVAAAQEMVDLRPNTLSYSRVAQLRSLHGDSAGSIKMMTLAAKTADPADKTLQSWCLVQLGDEHWKVGTYAEAEKLYDEALAINPGYFLALVSKGRLQASKGDFTAAEAYLKEAQTLIPNANATHLLADIYSLSGRSEPATAEYSKFDRMQTELGSGADHKKLILSMANRGMTNEALEMALGEYAAEKNIHSAELVAWTLYKAGRASEATPYIKEAMRLNTIDARLIFHAGMIARANGDRPQAKRLLGKALSQNPGFDLLEAQEAREVLGEMSKQ